jgi:transposase
LPVNDFSSILLAKRCRLLMLLPPKSRVIFVAVLGASNYTYACATDTQTTIDWVGSIINALEFVGGVPVLIVPDQASGLVARPDRYEPKLNRLVEEFSEHYGVTVLPARPAHPKDKPKVEVAVQIVERWILARLRNRQFFSLHELNAAIALLLVACRHAKALLTLSLNTASFEPHLC